MYMKAWIALLLISIFHSQSLPEYRSMSLKDLMSVDIVVASKKEEKVNRAPATVYVITQQDILTYGIKDLQEALKLVPSVYLSNPHSWVWGGQRGFLSNFSQTILMVNSREMNNLVAFEGFISNQFATDNIKQIEILASPGSAFYGANALAGVINVVTKESDKGFQGTKLHYEFGSYQTKAFGVSFGYPLGKHTRLSGSFRSYSADNEDFSEWISNTDAFVPKWSDRDYVKGYEHFGSYKNVSKGIPVNLQLTHKNFYAGVQSYYNLQGHGQEQISWDFSDREDHRLFILTYTGFKHKFSKTVVMKAEYNQTHSAFWGRYYAGFWPVSRLQSAGILDIFPFSKWQPNKGDRAGNTVVMQSYDRNKAIVYDETRNDTFTLQEYYRSFADYLIDQNLLNPEHVTKDDVHRYFNHIYTNKNSRGSQKDKFDLQVHFKPETSSELTIGYTFENLNYVGLAVTDAGTNVAGTYEIPIDLSKRDDVYDSFKHGIYSEYVYTVLKNTLWLNLGARFDRQNHYGHTFNPRSGVVFKPLESATFKLLYGEAFREPNVFEISGNKVLEPAKLRSIELSYTQEVDQAMQNQVVMYYNRVDNFLGSVGSLIGSNVQTVKNQTVSGIENSFHLKMNAVTGFINGAYIFIAEQEAVSSIDDKVFTTDVLGLPDFRMNTGFSYEFYTNMSVSFVSHFVNGYQAIGGSSGKKISIGSSNDLSATFTFRNLLNSSEGYQAHAFLSIKNLLDTDIFHPNIRRSGTEKFMQNHRHYLLRMMIDLE